VAVFGGAVQGSPSGAVLGVDIDVIIRRKRLDKFAQAEQSIGETGTRSTCAPSPCQMGLGPAGEFQQL